MTRAPIRTTLAFLGDSITAAGDWPRWFPEQRVKVFARNGLTTDGLLERVGDVLDVEPDELVVLIGTNDLGRGRSVEQLVRNVQLLLVSFRRELPASRVLMHSILPRAQEFAPDIRRVNARLRRFTSSVGARFLDLWPTFALESGELDPRYSLDRLHLTPTGYETWLGELTPALERLREAPPLASPIALPAFRASR